MITYNIIYYKLYITSKLTINLGHVKLKSVATSLITGLYRYSSWTKSYTCICRKLSLVCPLHLEISSAKLKNEQKDLSKTEHRSMRYYSLYNNVTSVCIFIGCWPWSIKGHTHRWRQIHVGWRQQTSFSFFMPQKSFN